MIGLIKVILVCLLLINICSGCAARFESAPNPPIAVSHVEIQRYLGAWFAVARIPNRFEKDCLQSRAIYSLNDDNSVRVLNSCPTREGKTKSVEGRGWILDSTQAKLEVGFFKIFGWYPGFARGNYWILALGAVDDKGLYSYALVGEPSRKYGWILARKPKLEESALDEAFKQAKEQGYSPEDFELL